MIEKFNYIFQYLEKEQINIDKQEFLFQIKSHPNHPSLLSIADTLTFFNIDNGAIQIEFSDIDLLPDRFIALLNEEKNIPQLYFIERKEGYYYIKNDTQTIKKTNIDLQKCWAGIVLLIEKVEVKDLKPTKNNKTIFFQILVLLLFTIVIFQLKTTSTNIFFLVLPILGILFSFAALKDLFGSKSELLNKFCTMTTSTSCAAVVGSNKWKIFEIINFSDLSIIFFVSQFLGGLIFLLTADTEIYFSIQKVMLIATIPILFLSIYYQKFVEKKWCPICIVIISIILLELGYLTFFQNIVFTITINSVLIFGFIFLSTSLIWFALKKLLIEQKELKEHQLKAIRFERNYDIFKNSLLSKDKINLPISPIILGNKNSKSIITIISSPFCSHCKDVHKIMNAILKRHYNDIQIQVILKVDLETENEESKKLFRSLILIYENKGEITFVNALKAWFDSKNTKQWFGLFPTDTSTEFDALYNSQYKWCEDNDYNFTPAIFINGYEYPKAYKRENLEFFVNDLIEDEF